MYKDAVPWSLERGSGPLVATALHDGHAVRAELADWLALSTEGRLREEDPFTGRWTTVAPTRLVVFPSRFEVDLNRPKSNSVYLTPDDAWGLEVWKRPLPAHLVKRSYALHDAFFQETRGLLEQMVARYQRVVVLDLHSYNHRRSGPDAEAADPRQNPEINLGTGTMDRNRWSPIVDRFLADLREFDFLGRRLDVRENVKFRGGYFPAWAHRTFPESVCVLAVEVKKFFMDEWTGRADEEQLRALERALQSTVWGIYEELFKLAATGSPASQ